MTDFLKWMGWPIVVGVGSIFIAAWYWHGFAEVYSAVEAACLRGVKGYPVDITACSAVNGGQILREWFWATGLFMGGVGIAPVALRLAALRAGYDASRRITDAFTEAMTLLGHERGEVRQGGIHVLGYLAQEDSQLHPADTIMDILSAYTREGSQQYFEEKLALGVREVQQRGGRDDIDEASLASEIRGLIIERLGQEAMPTDIEAAIAVIRRRGVEERTEKGEEAYDLSRACLFGANFREAKLMGVNFREAHAVECRFQKARLSKAQFENATLRNSNFSGADLSGADLRSAKLNGAELREARLSGADLTSADLSAAYLNGADLSKAKGLTQEQIDAAASGDGETKLPAGLRRSRQWQD